MEISIKLNEGAALPTNAHPSDTGYDLVAASEPVIIGEQDGGLWKRVDYVEYDCGIQVAAPIWPATHQEGDGWCSGSQGAIGYLLIYPRSSISKTNLVLANSVAVIDNSFRGTIKLRFRYLLQPSDFRLVGSSDAFTIYQDVDQSRIYQKGDKIGQAVAAWKQEIEWKVTDDLDETARQAGGFGSTGS